MRNDTETIVVVLLEQVEVGTALIYGRRTNTDFAAPGISGAVGASGGWCICQPFIEIADSEFVAPGISGAVGASGGR